MLNLVQAALQYIEAIETHQDPEPAFQCLHRAARTYNENNKGYTGKYPYPDDCQNCERHDPCSEHEHLAEWD